MTIARRLDKRGRFETQDILQLLPRAAGKYQSLEPLPQIAGYRNTQLHASASQISQSQICATILCAKCFWNGRPRKGRQSKRPRPGGGVGKSYLRGDCDFLKVSNCSRRIFATSQFGRAKNRFFVDVSTPARSERNARVGKGCLLISSSRKVSPPINCSCGNWTVSQSPRRRVLGGLSVGHSSPDVFT